VWVLAEGEGGMAGGIAATTLMTLGYDPAEGRFVGTWIGSGRIPRASNMPPVAAMPSTHCRSAF
jgi:hypothetical protein